MDKKQKVIKGNQDNKKYQPGTEPVSEIFSRFQHKEWAKRVALLLLDIEKDPIQREIVEGTLATIADMVRTMMAPKFKLIE